MFLNTKKYLTENLAKEESFKKISKFLREHENIANTYFAIENLQNGAASVDKVDKFMDMNLNVIKEGKVFFEKVASKFNYELNDIDQSIHYVVENKKTPINFNLYEKHYDNVKDAIVKRYEISESDVKIKELIESANPDSKKLLTRLAESENKNEFLEEIKRETKEQILEDITKTQNPEEKTILLEAYANVDKIKFEEKTFVNDTLKIVKIKEIISS